MPIVTVVTPTYNAARFLSDTIRSVQQQSFRDWEYVIVDDGSSDDSVEIAKRHAHEDPRIRVVRQDNQGVAKTRNRGTLEAANGARYILFLDHDDQLRETALQVLLERLENTPSAAVAFGRFELIDANGKPLSQPEQDVVYAVKGDRVSRVTGLTELSFEHVIAMTPIATPGQCLIRKDVLEQVGGFDPAVNPCDDWDIWLRISQKHVLTPVERTTLSWRMHESNVSKRYALMKNKREQVYRKHLDLSLNDAQLHKMVRVAYRFGMYDYDVGLAVTWGKEKLAQGEFGEGLRYLTRAVRLRSRRNLMALRAWIRPNSVP